jgi:hypothetical protein
MNVKTAVSQLREQINRKPNDRSPRLMTFSEFLTRNDTGQDRRLPRSIRLANRQIAEEIVSDDTLDYVYSEIPFTTDDEVKRNAVDELTATIARFTEMGNVLVFGICVMPE